MVVNLNKILQKQRDHKFSGKDRWVSRGVVGGPLIAAASWRCNDALMQRHALHQWSFPCNTAEGGVGRSRSRWLSSGHRSPLPPSNQTALHSTIQKQLFNALCVANTKFSLFDARLRVYFTKLASSIASSLPLSTFCLFVHGSLRN